MSIEVKVKDSYGAFNTHMVIDGIEIVKLELEQGAEIKFVVSDDHEGTASLEIA